MKRERKNYSPEEKVAILKRHLVDKVAVSDLCDEYSLQPTVFYRWQKEFFENGASAFARDTLRQKSKETDRIKVHEQKLQRKHHDQVLYLVSDLPGQHGSGRRGGIDIEFGQELTVYFQDGTGRCCYPENFVFRGMQAASSPAQSSGLSRSDFPCDQTDAAKADHVLPAGRFLPWKKTAKAGNFLDLDGYKKYQWSNSLQDGLGPGWRGWWAFAEAHHPVPQLSFSATI